MRARYAVGADAVLVTASGAVLVPAGPAAVPPAVLAALAELADLPHDLDVRAVVDALAPDGPAGLPDFAAVVRDGAGLVLLARGAVEVRVDDVVTARGDGAATWRETTAALGDAVELTRAGRGGPDAATALPLAGGVVLGDGVCWWPAGVPPTAPTAPEAPMAAPAAEFTVVRSRPAAPAPAPTPAPAVPTTTIPVPIGPPPPAPPPGFAPPPSAPPSAPPSTPPPGFAPPPAPPTGPPTAPPAAPATASPAPAPVEVPAGNPDHDGRTITPTQLQALREARAAVDDATSGPARRPFALELSTGRVVPVRRRVLIGRSPRIQQVGGSANLPALVTVDDPYVSGTHVEVRVEGSRLMVTDLSTNGTLLAKNGSYPSPLQPSVATEVAVGDVLTFSRGLTATVVLASSAGEAP